MKIRRIIILFVVFLSVSGKAQDTLAKNSARRDSTEILPPSLDIFKPAIGIGPGMFSFFGDLYSKNYQAPWTSRVAYDLNISQPLNNSFRLNFYVLFGKLGANERINEKRFVNFESQIRLGGVNLMYTFDHLIKSDHKIRPWVSMGVEGFEFLSKTDLFDRFGNRYYYWSDGSIRNMDENAVGASTNAIEILRDYTYESDIREMNLDGFGKYPERSWGIPVGAGALFKIGERLELKMGATFHYTFTDYIDGVSDQSLANRAGNKRNDCFVMTSFSLHYDLVTKPKFDTLPDDYFEDVDFLVLDNDDYDGDKVRDLDDRCHGTPPSVPVDKDGCPLDGDGDHIADHIDDEPNSTANAVVDGKGVEYTEERGAKWYELYYDSVGLGAEYVVIGNIYKGEENVKVEEKKDKGTQEFSVELLKTNGPVPDDVMMFILSIGDVKSSSDGENTVYTAGNYTDINTALQRKDEFVSEGIKDVEIGVYKNGQYRTMTEKEIEEELKKSKGITSVTPKDPKDTTSTSTVTTTTTTTTTTTATTNTATATPSGSNVIFRVQLGAYRNRISKNVFGKDASSVIELKMDDGYYRYVSGSHSTLQAAAAHRADLVLDGYPDAFITAYKDGKRVSLKEAGATFENKTDEKENLSEKAVTTGALDKSLVVFKVQLGLKKSANPEFEAQLKGLQDVDQQTTATGAVRYTAGKFSAYNDAVAYKNKLVNEGYTDAFVVAMFKDELISLQEAMEILKK